MSERSHTLPVTLSAWAKLTLSLRITGLRPDGYHLLDAEMVTVDLADTLEFTPGEGLTVLDELVGGTGRGGVPIGEENLVSRALDLLGRRACVRLTKRIPPGAGLGGGSADAAAVLRWARETDTDLAARLGADVPFCVRGGRARVRGVGEVVEPLAFEDRRFVVLLPPLAVSTPAVYRAWDARRASDATGAAATGGTAEEDVAGTDGDEGNDLEASALEVAPQLARWRDLLAEATGMRPRLAGSGSTWFVEGEPETLGIGGRDHLTLGPSHAPLVAVRTVPAEACGAG